MASSASIQRAKPGRQPRMRQRASGFLLSHRRQLWRSTRTEIHARYAGSLLGTAWIFLAPVLLLAIYGVVYLAIYGIKAEDMSSAKYMLYIFAGLVPYLATAESLTQGANSIATNRALLMNTVFPIDLAPVRAVLTALPIALAGSAIILVGAAAAGTLHWTAVLLPVVLLLQVLALVGLNWFLSLVAVVVRDVLYVLTVVLVMLLVLSPIAYTPSMVPSGWKFVLAVNPFAWFVLSYQKILVLGEVPGGLLWIGLTLAGVGLFLAGDRFFTWSKRVAMDYV
jgi:homopolymeric O-antigen transport system permease protein